MSIESMNGNDSPAFESRLDIWQAMIGQPNRHLSALKRTAIEDYVERGQPAPLRAIHRSLRSLRRH